MCSEIVNKGVNSRLQLVKLYLLFFESVWSFGLITYVEFPVIKYIIKFVLGRIFS